MSRLGAGNIQAKLDMLTEQDGLSDFFDLDMDDWSTLLPMDDINHISSFDLSQTRETIYPAY
jgi:hypothetical protein